MWLMNFNIFLWIPRRVYSTIGRRLLQIVESKLKSTFRRRGPRDSRARIHRGNKRERGVRETHTTRAVYNTHRLRLRRERFRKHLLKYL